MQEVYRDAEGWSYVLFEEKRMYFPKKTVFTHQQGLEYVPYILGEQGAGSPHLYLRQTDAIKEGDVLVDAGVCEGNFALRFIDRARKIYLIEADASWMEALERTFALYREKIVFCNKFLSRYVEAAATLGMQ